MERVKQIAKRIFCLPPLLTVLIAVPAFAAVIYALVRESEGSAFSYAAYGISAYALVITVTAAVRLIRLIRGGMIDNKLIGKLRDSPLGQRILKDALFRTEISLYQGLFINLLYAVWKLAASIYYLSFWFGSLAVYYALLALMRFLLLWHVNKNTMGQNLKAEFYRYRLCGILLLFMNLALAGIVILMVCENSGFEYPGMLIYVMALYAFYTITIAAVNVIRFRRYGSPVMSAAKVINLTAALVSMLSLETAMLTQFDNADEPGLRRIMTGTTGAAVCVLVLGMAVFMIVHATKQLKQLKTEAQYE